MDQLVTAAWLAETLDSSPHDLVVLDCTVFLEPGPDGLKIIGGHDNWTDGHIPTSGFADLVTHLSDTSSKLNFAVPSAEAFCAAMGELGVGDNTRVVLYDDNLSMWAARVWWMLRWVGFDNAALLDGGLQAWKAADQPLSTASFAPAAQTLTPAPRPELIADKAQVLAAVGDGATCIIDALSPELYSGEIAAHARGGHIPGATNTPARGLIDSNTGRYRDVDTLAQSFPQDHDDQIIAYCGGGIAASSDAFILTLLGYNDVAVYTASMQEWANDDDAPLTTDA